jgi:hypothetical protein
VAEPFQLIRRAVGFLMVGATAVSIGLAVTGVVPRAWLLAEAIWAAHGVISALFGGILEPAIDVLAFAAERYRERAEHEPRARAAAMARRAALLAGGAPGGPTLRSGPRRGGTPGLAW